MSENSKSESLKTHGLSDSLSITEWRRREKIALNAFLLYYSIYSKFSKA